ncbi:MAG TPA: lysophospholipid acyltransferase family protein [Methylobacterium sp.]|jgi:1-acyl-sn-glycerol-3-phosphate acyltransferase|uniref:lysophospholipid acyltransferase family protein n=1 Tax=Methylorubrum sp. B1-46 TaxID=2897334 RepID=UPI001E54244C|nr:lysophospholipid acyltransferase family protein [Methylorubrum sp. B1-46]UGB24610.1 lysophospholipid acyltransferase family protein [Methylorubrum sp. B1-46]HEV2543730.1 lysophospholipid acyltransferase family protein [Methylobacterium sp.]
MPRSIKPPERSPRFWRFMAAYFDRFVRRHLNALRLARWGVPAKVTGAGPLVIYANHPAWWDAAILIVAADRLFPEHESFAPIDAAMLEKYGIFRKMGAFPVDLDSARGGAQFLSASRAILGQPNRAIWITAQGRFADVRTRPLGLKPGVARLAEIAPEATFLPLAVEYAFWDERGAEAFLAFGPPLDAAELLALPRPERLARLEAALTAALDRLSDDVMTRDPARFETLLAGRRGVGGVYDGWRRLAAALAGRRFEPGHRNGDRAETRTR